MAQNTPLSSGAPKSAPDQTIPITADGPQPKGHDGHPPQASRKPQPAGAGSTGPIENGPSVNYDKGQETSANIVRHPNAVTPLGQQDQRT